MDNYLNTLNIHFFFNPINSKSVVNGIDSEFKTQCYTNVALFVVLENKNITAYNFEKSFQC